jgi:hypothetical protein
MGPFLRMAVASGPPAAVKRARIGRGEASLDGDDASWTIEVQASRRRAVGTANDRRPS